MSRVRSGRRRWWIGVLLASTILLLITTIPRSASDPVAPVQSGQGPASQGTTVSGSVSTFSGSFSTSVPIEVLPGRNGLQPSVSLSYASSNADGIAGVGWGFPVSSITRTGSHRGAPTYGPADEFYMSLNGASVQLMPTEPATVDPGGEFGIRHFKTRIES